MLTPWTENSPTDLIFRSAFKAVWKNRTARVQMSHLGHRHKGEEREQTTGSWKEFMLRSAHRVCK